MGPGAERGGPAYAALRRRFLDGLPQRRAAILDAPDAKGRQQALHRLAGAAGSYGFAALGELARHAEGQTDPAGIRQALDALEAALDGLIAPARDGDTPPWKSAATTPDTTSS